jgi:hypothetical protein
VGRGVRGWPHLDPSIPARDLAALSAASANVTVYVDKNIAHIEETARRGVPAETLLEVREIHKAIDVIGDLLVSYTKLLTAVEYAFVEPVLHPAWKAVFRVPWTRPGGQA